MSVFYKTGHCSVRLQWVFQYCKYRCHHQKYRYLCR